MALGNSRRILWVLGALVAPASYGDARLETVRMAPLTEAPAPRAVTRAPLPPASRVVRICYTDDPMIAAGCRSFNAYLRQCGLDVVSLENPTLENVREALKGLPANTNVSISSHGLVLPRAAARDKHHLAVPRGVGIRPEETFRVKVKIPVTTELEFPVLMMRSNASLRIAPIEAPVNVLSTKSLLAAIDETLASGSTFPSKYIGACHSGEACDDDVRCTGASCRSDQRSYSLEEGMEDQERILAYLMCSPGAFRDADTNKNGVLEGKEIAAFAKAHGLPRSPNTYPQAPQWERFVLYPTAPRAAGGLLGSTVQAVTRGRILRTHAVPE